MFFSLIHFPLGFNQYGHTDMDTDKVIQILSKPVTILISTIYINTYTDIPFGFTNQTINTETNNRYIAKYGCSYDHISRRHTPHGRNPPKTEN